MAGIGYRLKALVKEDTFTNLARGYLYSAVISSGPWLFTVLCLWLLSVLTSSKATFVEVEKFRITVIYVFAFSLVVTGFLHMVVSRYLSDALFADDTTKLTPAFITALATTAAVQFVIAVGFLFGVEAFSDIRFGFSLEYRWMATTLYVAVSCIWIAMIFLGAARDYNSIFLAFLLGTGLSFGGGWGLWQLWGLEGLLTGFTAGQLLILALLVARTLSEFEGRVTFDRTLLRYFNVFPTLTLVGFFYNLGIWVDKFFFMFGPTGTEVAPLFYANSSYTTPLFLAYLTIVPTLSLFVIRVETSFHDTYRKYYGTIVAKAPFREIDRARVAMEENLRLSAVRILKLQGTISLLAIVFAEPIADVVGMHSAYLPIFRVAVLASLLQAMLLVLVIMLLYLDQRTKVLWLSGLFFASNALFTAISLRMSYAYHGYGYAVACLVSVLVGYLLLDKAVRKLNFYTFMNQPVK